MAPHESIKTGLRSSSSELLSQSEVATNCRASSMIQRSFHQIEGLLTMKQSKAIGQVNSACRANSPPNECPYSASREAVAFGRRA